MNRGIEARSERAEKSHAAKQYELLDIDADFFLGLAERGFQRRGIVGFNFAAGKGNLAGMVRVVLGSFDEQDTGLRSGPYGRRIEQQHHHGRGFHAAVGNEPAAKALESRADVVGIEEHR